MIAQGVSDCWAVGPTADPVARRTRVRVLATVVAAVLALVGPAVRAWRDAPHAHTGAVVLALGALLYAATLNLRWQSIVGVAGRAVGIAAIAAAVNWDVGRAPVIVAVLLVTTAHVALSEEPALPGHPVRPRPTPLAIGPLVAASVVWLRTGNVAITAGLIAFAAAVIELHHRRPAAVDRVDGAFQRALRSFVTALGAVVTTLVAIPLLYLPGLVVRGARRLRPRAAAPTTWVGRTVDVEDFRRDARYPFVSIEPSERRTQVAVGILTSLALVAGLVLVIRSGPPERVRRVVGAYDGSPTTTGPADSTHRAPDRVRDFADLPAGRGLDWVGELQHEIGALSYPKSPVAGFTIADSSATYVNVRAGSRAGVDPPLCACPSLTAWLVGGSAAFGFGQRDDHTVASDLVAQAGLEGTHLTVRNIAVPGWTLWQEYQAVLGRLATGAERPDLVIFLDGFNDMAQSMIQTIANGPAWSKPVITDDAAFDLTHGAGLSAERITKGLAAAGGPGHLAGKAMSRFQRLQQLIGHQLKAESVDTAFFFQPDALSSPLQRTAGTLVDTVVQRELVKPMAQMLDAATEKLSASVTNLRHLFDEYEQPVFFDLIHVNESGASETAAAIYRKLRPSFQKQLAQPSEAQPSAASPRRDGSLANVSVAVRKVATLQFPTAIAQRPGSDDLYATERGGKVVRLVGAAASTGKVRTSVALDRSADTSTDSNRGMLGLEFSADGSTLYVDHTDAHGDLSVESYTMKGNAADPSSRRQEILIPMPHDDHNGGALHLGPDGALWLSVGDGGGWHDPLDLAQNPSDLRGKLLRLHPGTGRAPDIVAMGFRNPFRFSFDRPSGDIWIGDVGQESIEEIDYLPAGTRPGTNFGWSGFEGTSVFLQDRVRSDSTPPIFEMLHNDGWCAVVGGVVYRGSAIANLDGGYLFADLCSGTLHALRQRDGKVTDERSLGITVPNPVSIDQDARGEIWLASALGGVYKLVRR